jgi:hypothetical protein
MRKILRDSRTSPKAKAQALIELSTEQFPNGDREVRSRAISAAVRLYVESDDPRGKDEILGRLGSELSAMAEAFLPYRDEGLAVLGDHLYDIGHRLDDPDLARMVLKQALAVHEAYGNLKGQAETICRLCTLDLSTTDRPDPAMAQRAVELSAAAGDGPGQVYALHLMADIERRRGDQVRAKARLEEALRIARDCEDVDSEVATLMALANAAKDGTGGLERGRSYLLAAADLVPRLADAALGSTALNREALAYNLARQERLDEAAREALEQVRMLEQQRRRIGSAGNQARWYQEQRHRYRKALSYAVAADDGPAALEIIEIQRARALAGTLDADPAALASGLLEIDASLDRLLRRISDFEDAGPSAFQPNATLSAENAAGWNSMMADALAEDHELLAGQIGNALLRKAGVVESIADLRAKLGAVPDALVFDLEWDGDIAVVHAVWVPPLPGVPTVHEIVLGAEEAGWIRAFADPDAVTDLLGRSAHPWQEDLSWLIPDPLQDLLITQHGDVDLVIVPTGELWAVPFAALMIETVPLVELATITLAPSLAVAATASTRKVRRVRKAVALLDSGLRGAALERDALARHFQLTEVSDVRQLVGALEGKARYEVGVVSAHGDHVRGLAHALRIGDQRLFAAELLRHEVPLWWVMGACWSGGLDHEPGHEPIGLPTVALLRGARAVVAALHRVPDRATGRILAGLYSGLASGASAPAALRAAQRDYLSAERGSRRLVDWAPLVTIGAPA